MAKYKIDLSQYDAVVGPEYVRGGRQMCILYKGGQPSPLQGTIRAGFRVVLQSGATPTRSPTGVLQFKGKIGPGLRGAGGAVGGAIAMLGLQLLVSLLIERSRRLRLDDEMKRLGPEIDTAIRGRVAEVAELLSAGKQAYANITMIRIERTINTGVGGYSATVGELPKLEFNRLAITDQNIKTPEIELVQERQFNFDNVVERFQSTYSVGLTLSQQEVDLYKAYVLEIRWYESAVASASAVEDVTRLSKDKLTLETNFRAAFQGTK